MVPGPGSRLVHKISAEWDSAEGLRILLVLHPVRLCQKGDISNILRSSRSCSKNIPGSRLINTVPLCAKGEHIPRHGEWRYNLVPFLKVLDLRTNLFHRAGKLMATQNQPLCNTIA